MSLALSRRQLLSGLLNRTRKAEPAAAAKALPIVPFHVATCTLVEPPTPEEQAAFSRHIQSFRTRAACWEHAPYADWMLDTLRSEFHWVPITPERELRVFALTCLYGLQGPGALGELLALVQQRIARHASLEDLAAAQKRLHGLVIPAGVQGLPRLIPCAAGLLAAWHSATPNPYDAAFWTAEFAALHGAFIAVQAAASGEAGGRGSPDHGGWRAAFFDRAHPHVKREARMQARRAQAAALRRILPQPFAGTPAMAAPS